MSRTTRILLPLGLAVTFAAACGGSDSASEITPPDTVTSAAASTGINTVSAQQAAATIADAPPGLIVLDVRTPEEFAEGHLQGAVMIDFYSDDFDAQLATLDPDVPYVLYCRSGNRSGQTIPKLEALGFQSVENIDGGVVAWTGAGLPLIR